MNIVLKFLKWQFVPHGIATAEEERPAKKSYWRAFKRMLSGSVFYGEPTAAMYATYMRFGKPLKRYRCKFCGVFFWAWRKRSVCWRWGCVRQA